MRTTACFWLCVAGWAASQSLSLFAPAGVDFVHRNSPTAQKYLIETMGGGVAMLDYNGDGRLDLFFVNSGRLTEKPGDFARREPAYWNRLYRQNADGSFTDVTQEAGLATSPNVYGMGVAVGDYDNDGDPDLYVTNYGGNVLYRNDGRGGFVDVTAQMGVAAGGWSASAGFFDYDRDGRLDLFVTRYLDWDLSRNILCGTPYNAYCRPDKFPATTSVLFHNEGGRFMDVSAKTGIGGARGKALGVAFNDYDGDGWVDVLVANDGIEQFLFHNEAGKAFREVGLEAGVAFADDGKSFAGMGTAFADYDRDGRPDILITDLALEKYALFHNEGGGQFRYATADSGLATLTARSSGWGVVLEDFDNDGFRDVFVAQSHVLDNVERMHAGLRYLEPPALLLGGGGRFRNAGLEAPAVAGRGVAVGDLDNDGGLEAVVAVLGGKPLMFRARPTQHWLTVKLTGRASNRDGIGATVRVGSQVAHVSTAGSYLSASDARAHFGLGSLTEVTVEVLWPSGRKQTQRTPADRLVTLTEPE